MSREKTVSTECRGCARRTHDSASPRRARHDAPRGGDDELQRRLRQRERAGHDRGHRDAVRDQGRRVIHQALALEDGDDSFRHAALRDRRCGDGVGGETIAPSTNAAAHGSPGPLSHGRDGEVVKSTSPMASREIGRRLARSRAARSSRRGVQERRQEHHEHQVRVQIDLGRPGSNAVERPADDEQDRVRDRRLVGEDQQDGGAEQHREQREVEGGGVVHLIDVSGPSADPAPTSSTLRSPSPPRASPRPSSPFSASGSLKDSSREIEASCFVEATAVPAPGFGRGVVVEDRAPQEDRAVAVVDDVQQGGTAAASRCARRW